MNIFKALAPEYWFDIGTNYTCVFKDGKLVFKEPTKLYLLINRQEAIEKGSSKAKVIGIGNEVKENGENIEIIKPVNHSVIADFHAFEQYMRNAVKRITKSNSWFEPAIVAYFTLPNMCTAVEKRAFRDSGEHSGAKEVYMIYKSYLIANFLKKDLSKTKGLILVELGASKIEVYIISNGNLVNDTTVKLGVNNLLKSLQINFKKENQKAISQEEVEKLIFSPNLDTKYLEKYFDIFKEEFVYLLENMPSDIVEAALKEGIYIYGFGSNIQSLRNVFSLDGKIRIHHIADDTDLVRQSIDYLMSMPKKERNKMLAA